MQEKRALDEVLKNCDKEARQEYLHSQFGYCDELECPQCNERFGDIVSDERGQGLISAIVVMALISISMWTLMSLMVGLAQQQSSVTRKSAWTTAVASITQILQNPIACNYTVTGSGIRMADNSIFVQQGTVLSPTLTITSVSGQLLGPVTQITSVTGCTEDGSSHNWKCSFNPANAQQGKLTVVAKDKLRTYTQTYIVNVAVDSKGVVLGCMQ